MVTESVQEFKEKMRPYFIVGCRIHPHSNIGWSRIVKVDSNNLLLITDFGNLVERTIDELLALDITPSEFSVEYKDEFDSEGDWIGWEYTGLIIQDSPLQTIEEYLTDHMKVMRESVRKLKKLGVLNKEFRL